MAQEHSSFGGGGPEGSKIRDERLPRNFTTSGPPPKRSVPGHEMEDFF
jgi:hypothetical protein